MAENPEIFRSEGIIYREQLEEQLNSEGKAESYLGRVLLQSNSLSHKELLELLASRCTVPSVDLRKFRISAQIARLIPPEIAIPNRIVPVDRFGSILCLATPFPNNPAVISYIRKQTGYLVKVVRCSEAQMRVLLKKLYPGTNTAVPKTVFATLPSTTDSPNSEKALASRWESIHIEEGPVQPLGL